MNDTERARLNWRCRRGLLELDLLLQGFLEHGYGRLMEAEHEVFRSLLELPDNELLAYLLGQKAAPQGWGHVIEEIRRAAAVRT